MRDADVETLVSHRLEQARTAIEDAKFLLEGDRSPGSIINRSYYAMFYATLALLQRIGRAPSRHAGVISLLDREFVARGILPKELSKDIHKAFELRQAADYKVIETASREQANELLDRAVSYVEAVRRHLLPLASNPDT